MEILSEFDCKNETIVDRPSCRITPEDLMPIANEVYDILVKRGTIIPKVVTNAECIRELDNKHLALFLERIAERAWLIGVHGDMYDDGMPNNWEEWQKWLSKEVNTSESFTPGTK